VIVVSDTSPITSLADVGELQLLRVLFGTVIIPRAVSSELERGRVVIPDWVAVRDASDPAMVVRLTAEVDLGEAKAIAPRAGNHPARVGTRPTCPV